MLFMVLNILTQLPLLGWLRIYYAGANGPHGSTTACYNNTPIKRTCLGMAKVRPDRRAGLWSAGTVDAVGAPDRKQKVLVTTVPINCTGYAVCDRVIGAWC